MSDAPILVESDLKLLEQASLSYQRLRQEVGKVIIGQEDIVRPALAAIFCQGHTLIIGVPGLAKTLLEQLASNDGDDYEGTVTKLVELISTPDRTHRKRIIEVLANEGEEVYPLLISMMEDERLAVRAAAAHTLAYLSQTNLPFQPFDSAENRAEQITAWREKLAAS
jgi:hypothetical protein